MSITITPRGTENTTHTNGFELDRPYKAKREGFGFCVTLPNGKGERFVCADGGGGAHLFYWNGRHGYDSVTCTAGHFEIEVVE